MFPSKVLVLLLLCAVVLFNIGATTTQPEGPAVKRLLSTAPDTREKAQQELLAARTKLISELIEIVADKQNYIQIATRDSVRRAMFILGEMRAIEATEVLVANIGFPDVLPRGAQEWPFASPPHTIASCPLKTWPAVEALIKIGEPSCKLVLDKLATTTSSSEDGACIRVLFELLGRDRASAVLKDAIAGEQDSKRRERLSGALGLLLEAFPTDEQKKK